MTCQDPQITKTVTNNNDDERDNKYGVLGHIRNEIGYPPTGTPAPISYLTHITESAAHSQAKEPPSEHPEVIIYLNR
jgi:hypothetical protein